MYVRKQKRTNKCSLRNAIVNVSKTCVKYEGNETSTLPKTPTNFPRLSIKIVMNYSVKLRRATLFTPTIVLSYFSWLFHRCA